jgi:hypothetical protein
MKAMFPTLAAALGVALGIAFRTYAARAATIRPPTHDTAGWG